MFRLFKSDPSKKLKKQHEQKLEQAMHAQRNGDMRTYAQLSVQAEEINQKIIEIESKQTAV